MQTPVQTQSPEVQMQSGQRIKSVILLSGGMDSAVVMQVAHRKNRQLLPLFFDYNQNTVTKERGCAKLICQSYGAKLEEIGLDWQPMYGGSSLTSYDPTNLISGVPESYVPFRNPILMAFGIAYAMIMDAKEVWGGWNEIDTDYPDCSKKFIERFQAMSNEATPDSVNISIVAPLIDMTKTQIVKYGFRIGAFFENTWSCYTGVDKACGKCQSCLLRLKGFKEANKVDIIPYYEVPEEYASFVAQKGRIYSGKNKSI